MKFAPVLLLGTLAVACSKSEPAPHAAAEPAAASASVKASANTTATATAAPPRAKAHAFTTADALGTLPPGIGLSVGTNAPAFTLKDAKGKAVTLASQLAQGPVLLVFYRGGWCPYCNFQVRELARVHGEFREAKVTPVLVSVDQVSEAAKTSASWDLPFPVLSDPDLTAHEAYRVVHQVDAEEHAKLKGYGIDIEAASGKTHHRFAVPAVYLIDEAGKIAFAHADTDYKTRPSAQQLLGVVQRSLAR